MLTTILSWATIHEHGDLWFQHHQMRKAMFVDEMGWNVPHTDGAEWDQYDTPATIYVITHAGGRVLAASRMNPCVIQAPLWSYMIRDAAKGLLDGIPDTILADPPQDPETWEATRFAADPSLPSQTRNEALKVNAQALADEAKRRGIKRLIALMPPAYIRWLRSAGLPSARMGPTVTLPDGSRTCVIQMPLADVA